jgi:hypothetical protein
VRGALLRSARLFPSPLVGVQTGERVDRRREAAARRVRVLSADTKLPAETDPSSGAIADAKASAF